MTDIRKRKEEVLSYTKQSYREKMFAGTSGNLSTFDPMTGTIVITPSSIAYEDMTVEDIMVIDLDGNIIEGKHKPSSEWRMHSMIYREKNNVKAIVHTHSPYATSFAVNREEIPVVLIEMVPFIGGEVRVAEFAMPGTDSVGTSCVNALIDRNACLMANHGVLAIGENLDKAHIRAVYTEDAAKIYSLAKSNGSVHVIEESYVQEMLNRKKNR